MRKAIYLKQEVLLAAAIQEAERCGLGPEDTEAARTTLAIESRRTGARQDIALAANMHDTAQMIAAIRAGEMMELGDKELTEARWVLKEEVAKQKAQTMAKAAL